MKQSRKVLAISSNTTISPVNDTIDHFVFYAKGTISGREMDVMSWLTDGVFLFAAVCRDILLEWGGLKVGVWCLVEEMHMKPGCVVPVNDNWLEKDSPATYRDWFSTSRCFGGDSVFMMYSDADGSFAHSQHIPRQLYDMLKGRQAEQVGPEIVKLGKRSAGSFFIQYADGQYEWAELTEELDMLLKKNSRGVEVLALGDENIFYVKFKDGGERWRVSDSLADVLDGRNGPRGRGVVVGVVLGVGGDYCVQFADGTVCSEVGSRQLYELKIKFNMVEFVELGLGGD